MGIINTNIGHKPRSQEYKDSRLLGICLKQFIKEGDTKNAARIANKILKAKNFKNGRTLALACAFIQNSVLNQLHAEMGAME